MTSYCGSGMQRANEGIECILVSASLTLSCAPPREEVNEQQEGFHMFSHTAFFAEKGKIIISIAVRIFTP